MNLNVILGVLSGAFVGALGIKYYCEHKEDIEAKIKSLIPNSSAEKITPENVDVSLEELEAQKERLEDLIAELKSKKSED